MGRIARLGALLPILMVCLASCGGVTHESGDGGPPGGADGGHAGTCPADPPGAGTACPSEGLQCEWGTSNAAVCDTVATCTHGAWEGTTRQPPDSSCQPSRPDGCPSSYASVPLGAHCGALIGTYCDYPEGRCACAPPPGPAPLDASAVAVWLCQEPQSACPRPRPRLGAPCSPPDLPAGQPCDYGACSVPGGAAESCQGGVWVDALTACILGVAR